MTAHQPPGLVVELGRAVRVYDDGRTLVGGAPPRLLRLHDRAARRVVDRRVHVVDALTGQLADRLLSVGAADPVLSELPAVDPSEVTAVVPVRDRADSLDRLLTGLGGRLRVVVVDDASREPAAIVEVAARHGADLVALARNRGPAGARNAGLARVTTPFVAFVDSDIVVPADTLVTLARHFHLPRVAAVTPRILGLPATDGSTWISHYENARSSLDVGPDAALVRPHSRVGWVPGACLVARVDALGDGFTAGLRVAEDVDLVWRLTAAGWQVRHEPAVAAWHDHRTRPGAWLGRKAFYGTGAHQLARRHGTAVAPAVLTPLAAATATVLLAQRRWSAPTAVALVAVLYARLTRLLPPGGDRARLTADLVGRSLVATAGQTSALLLRHWWPLSIPGCLVSRRLRRAVLVAAVVDGLLDYRRSAPSLDPARFVLARRLDDLAYGAGLWAGAVRGGSARPLLPAFPARPERSARPARPACPDRSARPDRRGRRGRRRGRDGRVPAVGGTGP